MRQITINNNLFAVGFQWASSKMLNLQQIRQEAKKQDPAFDVVAFRQRQYGYAVSDGHPEAWLGVRSLAASMRMPATSFLGLFCLHDSDGEFWWVCAFSHGIILGMGDQVFSNREDAEKWILSLRGLLDCEFDEKIICNSVDDSLKWLSPFIKYGVFGRISGRANGYLISLYRTEKQRKKIILLLFCGIVILICIIFIKKFLDHQAGKRAMEAARIAIINKEKRKKEILSNPEQYFEKKWLSVQPFKKSIICGLNAMLALPMFESGWALERAIYDGKTITINWNYTPEADFIHLPQNSKIESPTKIISHIATIGIKTTNRDDISLLNRDQCTRLLYHGVQTLGAHLKLNMNPPEKKKIDDIEISSPWMRWQWELTGIPAAAIIDKLFPETITQLPSITLESIIFEKNTWTMKGAVYVDTRN